MLAMLDDVVGAAQKEGTLRSDVGTGDVFTLLFLLLRPIPVPPGASDWAVPERALAVMLDGLRVGGHSPLPGSPLATHSVLPQPGPAGSPRARSG
jgi:hypothetical protein